MKKTLKQIPLLILISLLLFSCQKTIDWEEEKEYFSRNDYVLNYRGTPFTGKVLNMDLDDLQGLYKSFPANELFTPLQLKPNEVYFKDGKLDGKYILLDKDVVIYDVNYSMGKELSSVNYIYYKEEFGGSLFSTTTFVNNKKNGKFIQYDKKGLIIKKGNYLAADEGMMMEAVEVVSEGESLGYEAGKDGIWEEFFEDGQLNVKESYKNGVKDGIYEYYISGGIIMNKGFYKDGKEDGIWEYYSYDDGKLSSKGSYKNGDLDGLYEDYYPNGKIKKIVNFKNGVIDGIEKSFDSNGEIILELEYKDGIIKDGTNIEKHENGEIKSIGENKNFKSNGLWKYFYPSKKMFSEGNFLDGLEDGEWKVYYENGTVKGKYSYLLGKPNGLFEEFYENGLLMKKGTLVDNVLEGSYLEYWESGKLKVQHIFKNGEIIKEGEVQY